MLKTALPLPAWQDFRHDGLREVASRLELCNVGADHIRLRVVEEEYG